MTVKCDGPQPPLVVIQHFTLFLLILLWKKERSNRSVSYFKDIKTKCFFLIKNVIN